MSDIPSKSKREVELAVEAVAEHDREDRQPGKRGDDCDPDALPAVEAKVIPFPTLRERFGRDYWLGDEWPR
jgi:hypothetical protein